MNDTGSIKPQAILNTRLERIERRIATVRRVEGRYPWLRLAAVVAFLFGSYLGISLLPPPLGWLLAALLLAAFVIVTLLHRRVIQSLENYEALASLTRDRLARAGLDWERIAPPLEVHVAAEHPFDRDLIVTGPRSLHHLLDTTSSTGASRLLARWLLQTTPDRAEIHRRQRLVRELLALPGLRARLSLDGALIAYHDSPAASPATLAHRRRWDGDAVSGWLARESSPSSLRAYLLILTLLAAVNAILFILNAVGLLPAWWAITLLVYLGLQSFKFRESSEVFQHAYSLSRHLEQLRVVLSDLECYPFQPNSDLARLCAPFCHGPDRPSRILRRAGQIAVAASVHGNPFLSLALNLLVPWDLFFAYQLERFKDRLRGILPGWLEAWYTLEALFALAEFAVLNPGYTFPEVQEPGPGPIFRASELGHPLLPRNARVANPFQIDTMGEVILVTGSNMSGKSTFLRTVGANLCLAYAGSVVCARSLRALPFRMFSSMNVSDSLSDGISYFYAEVRRLKSLLDALRSADSLPLFFLIDEIFRGTNNRERRVGSEAYLRALAGQNGAGLISTHDLELVRLDQEIPQMRNYHFREDVEGQRMVFDYRLRPGPSPTTNALRIMALAGLPVDPPSI